MLWLLRWLILGLSFFAFPAEAAGASQPIVVSSPGVRNLSFLPIELIPKIGADRAEGAEVRILGASSGSLALQHLVRHNCDFAAAGLTAMMSQQANGERVAVIAAINDMPTLLLLVRADLRKQVRKVTDLRGRVLAANGGTFNSTTASWQTLEFLLRAERVELDSVRMVASNNSWEGQSSLLLSGAVDALMANEPFATRLLNERQAFTLVDLSSPDTARRYPGAAFLHSALATRPELLRDQPARVETMIRILQRSLKWIASHTAEQIVERLGIKDAEEHAALIAALKKYPRLYSKDGHFSARQLRDTELFFRASQGNAPNVLQVHVDEMVFDKWVGRGE